jgi:simple sugar transport system substrate-binding protein
MTLCNGRAALRALVAAAALCSATLMAASPAHAAPDAKFVLISHAPDSDSWWNTIKNAIKQADEDFNVQTDYRNPPNGDIADMSRLIEQAAARNYDGVITTIADFDVLKSSLNKVTAKKIPLVTINSGTEEQSAQLGAIMHVGQPEYVAGKAAGEKAKAAGIKSFLCVNHIATNTVSFDRCRGFADALGVDRDPVESLGVPAQSSGHASDPHARTDARFRDAQGSRPNGPAKQGLFRYLRLLR